MSAGIDVNWFFFGLEKFKITVIRNAIIKLLSTAAIFLFVKKQTDVYVYAFIYVFGMFVSQFILICIIHKYVKLRKVGLKDIAAHIKPDLMLFVPVVAVSLYKIMDKIMLGSMVNETEVGYYEACEKIMVLPTSLITALGTVMLPRMSNLIANQEIEKSKQYISKSISFAMFLSTSLSFGIMSVAREFVPLFYGKGFEKCITLFQILLPSCIFIAFANVIRTQYLIPNEHDKISIVSVCLGAVTNLFINLLLIPKFQSIGAAIGTLFAECVVCLYQSFSVRKNLSITRYLQDSFPFFIAGIVMYVFLVQWTIELDMLLGILIIKVIAGALLYICIVAILKWIEKQVNKFNLRK